MLRIYGDGGLICNRLTSALKLTTHGSSHYRRRVEPFPVIRCELLRCDAHSERFSLTRHAKHLKVRLIKKLPEALVLYQAG